MPEVLIASQMLEVLEITSIYFFESRYEKISAFLFLRIDSFTIKLAYQEIKSHFYSVFCKPSKSLLNGRKISCKNMSIKKSN